MTKTFRQAYSVSVILSISVIGICLEFGAWNLTLGEGLADREIGVTILAGKGHIRASESGAVLASLYLKLKPD